MNLKQLQTFSDELDRCRKEADALAAEALELTAETADILRKQTALLEDAAKKTEARYAEEESRRKGWAKQYTAQAKHWLTTLDDPLWQAVKDNCFLRCVSHGSELQSLNESQLITFLQETQNEMEQVVKRLKDGFIPPSMSAVLGRVIPGYKRKDYHLLAQHYTDILCAAGILENCGHIDRSRAATAAAKAQKLQAYRQQREDQDTLTEEVYRMQRSTLQETFAETLNTLESEGVFRQDEPFHPGVCYHSNPLPGTALPPSLQETENGSLLHFPLATALPDSSCLLLSDDTTCLCEAFVSYGLDVLTALPKSQVFYADSEGLGSHYSLLAPLLETGRVHIWSSEEETRRGLAALSRRVAQYHAGHQDWAANPCFLFVEHLERSIPLVEMERLFRILRSGAAAGVFVLFSLRQDVIPERPLAEQLQRLEGVPVFPLKGNRHEMGNGGVMLCPWGDLTARTEALRRADAARRTRARILPLASCLPDTNCWQQKSAAKGIEIPVGSAPNGSPVVLRIYKDRPYVLIIGDVGSGKSSLAHTVCLQIMANYHPDEVRLAIGDFRMGAEFNTYAAAKLPSVEAVVNDEDPDVMVSFLQYYVTEMQRRREVFARLEQASGQLIRRYEDYREVWEACDRPTEAMPRLVLLIDEFQSLFEQGGNTAQLLNELVRKGCSFGIHLIMASQRAVSDDARNGFTSGLKNYFTARFVLHVPQAAARTVLSERCADTGRENSGIALASTLPVGHAILNTYMGELESANQQLQCCYPDDETIRLTCQYLQQLNGTGGRVLLAQGASSPERVLPDRDCLLLGRSACLHHAASGGMGVLQEFPYVGLRTGGHGQNLLLTGSDLRMAHSVTRSAALYLLNRDEDALVHVFGLPDAPLVRELRAEADPIYVFHTTEADMLAELQRQAESSSQAVVNLFVELDTLSAFAQGYSSRPIPAVEALKAVLTRAQATPTVNLLYGKTFRNLCSQTDYAVKAAPVRLIAVGDSANLRAAMPEPCRVTPSEFDLPRDNAICAYYCNAETGKWGKALLFAL